MAPQQKNASKASKLKSPKGGIQKSKGRVQNKKSVSRAAKTVPRPTKKTTRQPSVSASPSSNASSGGKWIWTEHPPTKEQTAANGRQKGRSLVQWNRPDTAITLLLNTLYQASIQGHKLSMDAIAHRTHCGASGQSLIQHLARERRKILKRGRMAPPVTGTRYDPTVRGVVLEPTSDNPNAERKISFRDVDNETDFDEPELEEPEFEDPAFEEAEFEEPEFDEPELEDEMSQEAKGKQIERSYFHAYTMASPETDFQEQHPRLLFSAPQNNQMPWMQSQSSLSAPLGTANPFDKTQPFDTQALDTPQVFGQHLHRNGFGDNFNLPMPSMPNDIGTNAQEPGSSPDYDNMATSVHGLGPQKLEPPSRVYEHWPDEYYRIFGRYPGDSISDTEPWAINNPSTSLFQDTLPTQGMFSSTSPFGEQENGGGTMNDADFGQWVQEQDMHYESGTCFGL
ncbi:uncharacterized protein GLRG_05153 [Colletotrichum graminicola M1.001]|uniref:Uncharacterized protein n=1 Tax=Colletotrichum graminicola (strain M1.001 / M2 / FGSC 10212) TaxID=645133 RepID=E3QGM1_COLGM|nr:uncharacterized protein GLRG_05153 [Colletotrichum graminicola M1.001]EFQ30009.1 hypothetical protein GLRG_05153 [Colletotrichum graminicola M1.001]